MTAGGLDLSDPAQRTLGRVLRAQAERHSDRIFVRADGVEWTFADVDRRADGYAAGLAVLGVARGDTVALLMENAVEQVPLTFGVNRLGAVWVPTNTDYKGEWLEQSLRDSRARVLCVDAGLHQRVAELGADLPFEHVVVRGELDSPPVGGRAVTHRIDDVVNGCGPVPRTPVEYGDTAAVLWTSGTTGRAKGVMQSHNAWIRASLTGAASSRTGEDDVLYCCLPLFNSAAWIGVIYRALVSGVPFGFDPSFSVRDFWDRTRHFGATQTFTLGSMHLFLWQAPERPDDADNPVRCMGAIPMPDAILPRFKERFGIDLIQQGYGQSEIMGLISRVDDGHTRWKPNSVGAVLPGIEVALLDDDDRPVAVGEIGEFCVRPTEPHVLFNGYFCDPEATVEAFRNLWYHTGDLGRVDGDGQYFFADRKRDLIRFKGRSVSSFAVEAAVTAHPAVSQAAAFGVCLDGLSSEAEIMVAVVVVPGAAVSPEELARFVNDRAPHFLVPRFIEFVDHLPITPTGKVQKFRLRERGASAHTWDRTASEFEVRR